jgi:branched-chain amino acid transport system ATP-binding protein
MTPEGRHLFAGMSVHDNLLVGAHSVRDREVVAQQQELTFSLFPILEERRNQIAGTLSGGEQQMCAIGRALMSAPRLLLIDELSLGLSPVVVSRLVESLKAIRKRGTTLVVVEQDAALAMMMADRAYILDQGRIRTASRSDALPSEPRS